MAKNKTNNRSEREKQLADVAHLYLSGRQQADVARELGVSPQQISYDLRILRTRWKESALRDFDEKRAIELARIDRLELEYWQAWRESRQPQQKTATERGGRETKAKIERVERNGDPRFLQGVQWCIERRCELLGLNAAKKLAGSGEHGEFIFRVTYDDEPDGNQNPSAQHADPSAAG